MVARHERRLSDALTAAVEGKMSPEGKSEAEALTGAEPAARSLNERVTLSLPLEISGGDLNGREFVDRGYTKILSRNGAAIVVNRLLAPEQTLNIRRVGASVEAEVRVIGQIGSETDGKVYGVAFVDRSVNIWDIEFSASSGGDVLRVLLECPGCRSREIVALNELELSVFEASERLSRRCSKCREETLWSQSKDGRLPEAVVAPQVGATEPVKPELPPNVSANRRKFSRTKMELKGCILFCHQETPLQVVDMSRGGIRVHSSRNFADGLLVRIAVPYTPGAANIFVTARIRWSRTLPSGAWEYGMEYVKS